MERFILEGNYKAILAALHLDATEVLRRAGLTEDTLNHSTITLKEGEYYRFLQAMGDALGSAAPLLQLAGREQLETFSPPIFAAWCSENGEACLERLAAYKKLIGPMGWTVEKEPDRCTVVMAPGDPALTLPSILVQSDFAFLLGLLRRATKTDLRPVRLVLQEKPQDEALADLAGIPVETGDKNAITFRREDLQRPFLSFNPAMWSYFEPEMNKRLAELTVDDSAAAKVRSALAALLPAGTCGIDDVAKKLGVSRRTLQRKLSEENTTFQKQLSSTRETLAIHYICHTELSDLDIAFLLGYAEPNSFLRAFTLWTGRTVSQYRKGV